MKYTLYIDESGDFETQRGQWVLSGVLFADIYENCEKLLINKLSSVPKQLGYESIKDFHLTEFRQQYGHKTAVAMAETFLNKLNTLPFDYHFLATINYTKSSLSEREKTYILMVADLYFEEEMKRFDCFISDELVKILEEFDNTTEQVFKMYKIFKESRTVQRGLIYCRVVPVVKIINGLKK